MVMKTGCFNGVPIVFEFFWSKM